jgi:hypothetical protein
VKLRNSKKTQQVFFLLLIYPYLALNKIIFLFPSNYHTEHQVPDPFYFLYFLSFYFYFSFPSFLLASLFSSLSFLTCLLRERDVRVEMRERWEDRPKEGRKRTTQPVGWPPDWADDTAGPAGHGSAAATSLVDHFRRFYRYPYHRKPNFSMGK